jgi:hypothetical protein
MCILGLEEPKKLVVMSIEDRSSSYDLDTWVWNGGVGPIPFLKELMKLQQMLIEGCTPVSFYNKLIHLTMVAEPRSPIGCSTPNGSARVSNDAYKEPKIDPRARRAFKAMDSGINPDYGDLVVYAAEQLKDRDLDVKNLAQFNQFKTTDSFKCFLKDLAQKDVIDYITSTSKEKE